MIRVIIRNGYGQDGICCKNGGNFFEQKHLHSTSTFCIANPINKLIEELKTTLKRWLQLKYITVDLYNRLNSTNAIMPRAYGLPKIHKEGFPLRIIVLSTGSPLHNLATFLQNALKISLTIPQNCCKNSIDLINKIQDIHIPDDFDLIFLDVTSLFTNVHTNMILNILESRWNLIEHHTSLPKNEFLDAINMVLNSYFKFNDKVYKQIYGTPMSSPLSLIVADLALQDLELHTLSKLPFSLPFYVKYVDDIVLVAPHHSLDLILHEFNSFHTRLKFTMEARGNKLNFLELKIINKDGKMIFD